MLHAHPFQTPPDPPKKLSSVMLRSEHDREVARLKARLEEAEASDQERAALRRQQDAELEAALKAEHGRQVIELRDYYREEIRQYQQVLDSLRRKLAAHMKLRNGILALAEKAQAAAQEERCGAQAS